MHGSAFATMSSACVISAANSAPSGRDYASEISALLAQSEEKRRAAEEIDTGIAVASAEARLARAAEQALQRGADAAEVAKAKIAEQQDRFKTGLLADGVRLDAEMVESNANREGAAAPVANKYSMQLTHKKKVQEQQRMAKSDQ